MTFSGMGVWQSVLLLGAAAAAAAWLFRLKVRPPRVSVPSLLLWRRVLAEQRELSWWDRVRRAVSLAATVAIALALALAVTRPVVSTGGRGSGRVLLVMDSSLSMQAKVSSGGTRWTRAVAAARREAASHGDVILATTADGVIEGPTADLALIDAALDSLAPRSSDAGGWPRLTGVSSVHFFTDGAMPRPLDPAVIVHSAYEPAPNVAITAFGTRPATSASGRAEAYLEVSNYAPFSQQAHLTVTRGAAVILDRSAALSAGEALRQVLALEPGGAPRLIAHVSADRDALSLDDEAVAWMEEAHVISLDVVSDRPGVFVSLLQRDPSLRVRAVAPADYQPGAADVFLFDRWLPPAPPVKPALCVAPPDAPWLGARRADEPSPAWVLRQRHPVLAGVDPSTLEIRHVRAYEATEVLSLAASEKGASLVSVRDRPQSRLVIFGFAAADSNLESAAAFPVLVGNAIEWLARPRLAEPGPPGPRVLPLSTTKVTAPSGRPVPIVRAGDGVVAEMNVPGLYLVEAGGARSVITIGVTSPQLSNLSATSVPGASARRTFAVAAGGRPWWLYAVAFAWILVVLEWWTWQRRITV